MILYSPHRFAGVGAVFYSPSSVFRFSGVVSLKGRG